MNFLTVDEVIKLQQDLIAEAGGLSGLRDRGGLESAVAQPQMTFGGVDRYPELADKAAALAFSLVLNHSFLDGNKRIGHAAMEAFLVMNGYEVQAGVDEQEQVILNVAAGSMTREEFTDWVRTHIDARS